MHRQRVRFVFSALLFITLAVPTIATAQSTPSVRRGRMIPVARTAADIAFDEMASASASMELALIGVPSLTDAQRDSLEVIERTLREQVLASAARIRTVRDTKSSELIKANRQLFHREVDAIMAARQTATERVGTILTQPQQQVFRRNVLELDDWYGGFWGRYAGGGYTSITWTLQQIP